MSKSKADSLTTWAIAMIDEHFGYAQCRQLRVRAKKCPFRFVQR